MCDLKTFDTLTLGHITWITSSHLTRLYNIFRDTFRKLTHNMWERKVESGKWKKGNYGNDGNVLVLCKVQMKLP